ncbi:MAG: GNAT family N-acetyltransferase [Bacteroidota bacterium]
MEKFLIESPRLGLRLFLPTDAPDFYRLNADPLVMQYVGDPPFSSVKEAAAFLRAYDDYARFGMGRWTVIRKADQAFLGWCGLKQHSEGWVDLGYRFHRSCWGKGYATEAAQASMTYGREVLGLTEVMGRAAQDNLASIQVLKKVGMQFWKEEHLPDLGPSVLYRWQKS